MPSRYASSNSAPWGLSSAMRILARDMGCSKESASRERERPEEAITNACPPPVAYAPGSQKELHKPRHARPGNGGNRRGTVPTVTVGRRQIFSRVQRLVPGDHLTGVADHAAHDRHQ